jgi:hypothetical protein
MTFDTELVMLAVLLVAAKPCDIPADPKRTEPSLAALPMRNATSGCGLESEFRGIPEVAKGCLDRFKRDSCPVIRDRDGIESSDLVELQLDGNLRGVRIQAVPDKLLDSDKWIAEFGQRLYVILTDFEFDALHLSVTVTGGQAMVQNPK